MKEKKNKISFDVFKKMIRYTDLRFCVKNLNFEKWITKKIDQKLSNLVQKMLGKFKIPFDKFALQNQNDYLVDFLDCEIERVQIHNPKNRQDNHRHEL